MLPTGETVMAHVADGPLGARTFDDASSRPPAARRSCSPGPQADRGTFDDAYPYAQVFAPEADDVIAFEPMTAPTNALASGVDLPSCPRASGSTRRSRHGREL